MLTPDEMTRIEEEERKRHAEEEYRKTVRSNLKEPSKKRNTQLIVVLVGILAVILVLAYVASFARGVVSLINPVPKTVVIASGEVGIEHGRYISYRIVITPAMRNPVVTGNFTVAGGSGNDVMGVIATETDYLNWINGHTAQAFWSTQGKATAGSFNVSLPPGTYYLALSNRFSIISNRQVSLNASLNYEE